MVKSKDDETLDRRIWEDFCEWVLRQDWKPTSGDLFTAGWNAGFARGVQAMEAVELEPKEREDSDA